MSTQLEPVQRNEISPRWTAITAVKRKLLAELQDLARQNNEITERVRTIRQIKRRLASAPDPDEASCLPGYRLIRACRIALMESEQPQTVNEIYSRIGRRASYSFVAPENGVSEIIRALANMAVRGEVRCMEGSWERVTLVEISFGLRLRRRRASVEK
jgi:hypothetical protein